MSAAVFSVVAAVAAFVVTAGRRRRNWWLITLGAVLYLAVGGILLARNHGLVYPWLAPGVVTLVAVYLMGGAPWEKRDNNGSARTADRRSAAGVAASADPPGPRP